VDQPTGFDKIAGAILDDAHASPAGRGPGWPESLNRRSDFGRAQRARRARARMARVS